MKHHKGDYMKCEHYGINPNHSLSDEICLCNGDTPAPGWRDVREFVNFVELLTDPEHSNFENLLRCQSNLSQIHILATTLKKELPAPPEGVQR